MITGAPCVAGAATTCLLPVVFWGVITPLGLVVIVLSAIGVGTGRHGRFSKE